MIGRAALIDNPALQKLTFLIGRWRTVGRHPLAPGKVLNGRTSFEWHEGSAFLLMRSEIDEPRFPSGVAIIGSDDAGAFSLLYFDERRVSRVYVATVDDGRLTWSRDSETISQTMTIQSRGRDTLESQGRLSQNRGEWSDDLSQLFTRER